MSLSVENLRFAYGRQEVLKGISFTASEGELLSVLGCNGAGKSTLFKCMLGLLSNYSGRILADGQDIKNLSLRTLAKKTAYIPQLHYPAFNYSVFDMVLMGTAHRVSPMRAPDAEEKSRAWCAISQMGIEDLSERSYNHLSGGEQQLVLIARALAQETRILILDEPTASLDFGNRIRVLAKIKELAGKGYTVIQSTHDPENAFMYSDRVIALKDGRLIADGPPAEILTSELMKELYGVDVDVRSLDDDKIRVCIPINGRYI